MMDRAVELSLIGLLRCASWLVPAQQRNDWLAEWKAELYVLRKRPDMKSDVSSALVRPLPFCLGSFSDAFWLSWAKLRSERSSAWLTSPLSCLLLLSGLAAMCWLTCHLNHGALSSPLYDAPDHQSLGSFVLQVLMALVVLPVTTSLSLGDYPVDRSVGLQEKAWRPKAFLLAKILIVLVIAYAGALGLTRLAEWMAMRENWSSLYRWIWDSPVPLQSFATILLALFGLRWVLGDQRERCPVCLRLLSNRTSVGHPSHIFLAWSGTESICRRGHGLLHVPDVSTSWFHTQRWRYLDSSWRQLFP
jgi:hypothetical protein